MVLYFLKKKLHHILIWYYFPGFVTVGGCSDDRLCIRISSPIGGRRNILVLFFARRVDQVSCTVSLVFVFVQLEILNVSFSDYIFLKTSERRKSCLERLHGVAHNRFRKLSFVWGCLERFGRQRFYSRIFHFDEYR